MRRWTESLPKALIPVLGRPFADRQLEWLAAHGVTEVVYCVGYRAAMVRAALGDGARFELEIRYVDEGERLRGTAGALRLAADEGALHESFFVLYGDSFLTVDLGQVWASFVDSEKPALMTVFRNAGQWDRSNVVYHAGVVQLYDKGAAPRPDMVYIDYGLAALTRGVVESFVPAGATADLSTVYHQLSLDGRLAGFEATARFYEIGSEDGLRSLESYLIQGQQEVTTL
jgi:NDP-sugar pyrophosphorylase family protein